MKYETRNRKNRRVLENVSTSFERNVKYVQYSVFLNLAKSVLNPRFRTEKSNSFGSIKDRSYLDSTKNQIDNVN